MNMQYRTLGRTGLQSSVIGLGCEHLDNKPYTQVEETIHAALDCGVNILDVFMPGETVRTHIARAIGKRRSEVLIQGHLGATDINQQYDISRDMPTVQRYFEDLLRIFGGYIDLGMLFFIDSQEDYKAVFETDFASYAMKLKQNGDIRHIGFSSHNPVTAIKAVQTGLPELMLFSINPAFDMLPPEESIFDHFEDGGKTDFYRGIDPRRTELYQLCAQKQVGITVMKSLGAGKLLSREFTPFARPLTVQQCVHYALSRPAVSSVLLGCKNAAEIVDAMRYLTMDDKERDYSAALRGVRNDFQGNCVYCSHCQPCPSGIDIAAVHKYLDIAKLTPGAIPPSIRSHYSSLAAKGSNCITCGSCEERCPFGVPIMDNLRQAEEWFEK